MRSRPTARQGQDFWQNAIEKEMAMVMVVVTFRSDDRDPKQWQEGAQQFVKCHMVLDVK
jgi:hypothetical protein